MGKHSDSAGSSKVRVTSLELWPHDSGRSRGWGIVVPEGCQKTGMRAYSIANTLPHVSYIYIYIRSGVLDILPIHP